MKNTKNRRAARETKTNAIGHTSHPSPPAPSVFTVDTVRLDIALRDSTKRSLTVVVDHGNEIRSADISDIGIHFGSPPLSMDKGKLERIFGSINTPFSK